MNASMRRFSTFGLTVLLAIAGQHAHAQYRSARGDVFEAPHGGPGHYHDAPSAVHGSTSQGEGADPYDPSVWLAKRQVGRGRFGSAIAAEAPSGPVRRSSYNSRQPMPGPVYGQPTPAQQPYYVPGSGPEFVEGSPGGPYPGEPFSPEMYGPEDGFYGDGPAGPPCHSCQGGYGPKPCNHCGGDGTDCIQGCCLPCPYPKHVQVFAGVQGFKGTRDLGLNGNFGFHGGLNISGPFKFFPAWGLGYQVGWQGVASNLSGTVIEGDSRRDQSFFTAGLFRNAPCGLQYGVAWDWLRDSYLDKLDVNQLRAQISLINQHGREIGFMMSLHTRNDVAIFVNNNLPVQITLTEKYQAVDQFLFFHRWNFGCSGRARLWGGFTSSSEGVFGGDAELPMNDRFSLAVAANYLIPSNNDVVVEAREEQWNLSINLVWHWKCQARTWQLAPYRPMFSVADNGSFFLRNKN